MLATRFFLEVQTLSDFFRGGILAGNCLFSFLSCPVDARRAERGLTERLCRAEFVYHLLTLITPIASGWPLSANCGAWCNMTYTADNCHLPIPQPAYWYLATCLTTWPSFYHSCHLLFGIRLLRTHRKGTRLFASPKVSCVLPDVHWPVCTPTDHDVC